MSNLLISKVDYQRIFRTIFSVLQNEGADLPHSCLWFNVIGAAILNRHYGIKARPVAGTAGYRVSAEERGIILFSSIVDDKLTVDDQGWHCWIETDEWFVDFMAPLFPILAKEHSVLCAPNMMQRKIRFMKESINDLHVPGDFFAAPDADITKERLQHFASLPVNHDFIEMCSQWYAKPPKQMAPGIEIFGNMGQRNYVELSRFEVKGAW